MSEMFTIYVCPNCDTIATEVTASQHDCRPLSGMWVTTKVIEYAAFERLERDYHRLRFTLDAVLDRATRPKEA